MNNINWLIETVEPSNEIFKQKVLNRILKTKNHNTIYWTFTYLRDSYKETRRSYLSWIEQAKLENRLNDRHYETKLIQYKKKMEDIKEAYRYLFNDFILKEKLL